MQLLQRKIRKFNEANWWKWGRDYYKSEMPRIYVNTKHAIKSHFSYTLAKLMMAQL